MSDGEVDAAVILPEIFWTEVYRHLSIADRGRLSQTCKSLRDLYWSASIWKSVELNLEAPWFRANLFREPRPIARLTKQHKEMIQRFGHCIKVVTIITTQFSLDHETNHLLWSMIRDHDILKFTLVLRNGGSINFLSYTPERPFRGHIYNIVNFLLERQPNCILHLDYILDSKIEVHLLYNFILSYSSSDLRLKHLWRLTGEVDNISEDGLGEKLGISKPTASLISKFPSLQHLHIWESLLSTRLLLACADTRGRCQLLTLNIDFITGFQVTEGAYTEAWSALCSACPALEVSVITPSLDPIAGIITKETPLVSVRFWASVRHEEFKGFNRFCLNHANSLRRFFYKFGECQQVRWEDVPTPPLPVPFLVDTCSKLRHFEHHGLIRDTDVVTLAKCSHKWQTFVICGRFLMFDNEPAFDNLHSQEIIDRANGVCLTVSKHFGWPWTFSCMTFNNDGNAD